MAEVKPAIETFAKIKVIGVGGSGGSAVNRMIKSKIKGVEFIAANTDVQALHYSQASVKIHLGKTVTRGLGAGMNPEVGRLAAEESQTEIREALKGADMIFITCGLGGGTGTGAAPVIAEIAKDVGALTVAVVTKPFVFEGAQRKDVAERGYTALAEHIDTIISIPNDKVLQIIDKKTSLIDAFETVDDVLRMGVQGISELITVPGMINVDFADVRAIMNGTGTALMGIGRASGEGRAIEAAKQAVASPLLEVSIDGAKGVLFTITGGPNLSMHEVSEAARVITANADTSAKVIFGAVIDETMKDDVKICVIATGFGEGAMARLNPLEKQAMAAVQQTAKIDAKAERPKVFATKAEAEERAQQSEREVPLEEKAPEAKVEPEFVAAAIEPEAKEEIVPQKKNVIVMREETDVLDPAMFSLRKLTQDFDDAPKPAPLKPRNAMVELDVEESVRSSFSKRIINEKEPMRETSPARPPSAKNGSEEDLDIPAFLRRKMM